MCAALGSRLTGPLKVRSSKHDACCSGCLYLTLTMPYLRAFIEYQTRMAQLNGTIASMYDTLHDIVRARWVLRVGLE